MVARSRGVSLDFLEGIPEKVRGGLDDLASLLQKSPADEADVANGELAAALDLLDDGSRQNREAEQRINDADPFRMIEPDLWARDRDSAGNRYVSPDFTPKLIEGVRILRASF